MHSNTFQTLISDITHTQVFLTESKFPCKHEGKRRNFKGKQFVTPEKQILKIDKPSIPENSSFYLCIIKFQS